jgi:NAD(P)-dependent dehydrogenase (short-subunit alcohol dehydrogenase family)
MYASFSEKTAIVTGGASGIGLACMHALAQAGARVISLDRTAADDRLLPDGARQESMDVSDREALEDLQLRLSDEGTEIGYLVNCAGIVQSPHRPAELSSEEFRRVLSVDLEGTFNACSVFGTPMARRGSGAIVNIASVAGIRSMPLHAYSPAKAGVISLSECLAAEWGRSGVRVNSISPGYTLTAALQSQIDLGNRDPRRLAENTCLGEIIRPEHIADSVLFLLSEKASMITGINLPVDAGWLAAGSWNTFGGVRERV